MLIKGKSGSRLLVDENVECIPTWLPRVKRSRERENPSLASECFFGDDAQFSCSAMRDDASWQLLGRQGEVLSALMRTD